jgi:hypothetical protein
MKRTGRRRLSRLEKQIEPIIAERERREMEIDKRLRQAARDHATMVVAVLLHGAPQIKEPLRFAWWRARDNLGLTDIPSAQILDRLRVSLWQTCLAILRMQSSLTSSVPHRNGCWISAVVTSMHTYLGSIYPRIQSRYPNRVAKELSIAPNGRVCPSVHSKQVVQSSSQTYRRSTICQTPSMRSMSMKPWTCIR